MRVLLDSNIPRAFAGLLPGHRIETTHRLSWSDLDDGPLLRAAEESFDAFVTMDQNLRYQQNLKRSKLRIIVLRAPSNRLTSLAPLAPLVLSSLAEMTQRQLRTIGS